MKKQHYSFDVNDIKILHITYTLFYLAFNYITNKLINRFFSVVNTKETQCNVIYVTMVLQLTIGAVSFGNIVVFSFACLLDSPTYSTHILRIGSLVI